MLLSKPVIALGAPCRAGGRLWRLSGTTKLTVWVRATVAFDADGRASFVETDPPLSDEEESLGAPTAGVVLVGHAYSGGGRASSEVVARLVVSRGNALLVDKSVCAVGDVSAGGGRAPFTRMPLSYDKAVGGSRVPENPVGVSYAANLIDPQSPTRPACFAPIDRSWPIRQRLFGEGERGGLEPERRDAAAARRYAAPPEVPADFDFGFFQCAPRDQRAAAWAGDETITLHAMHPARPRIDLELPGLMAEVRVADRWGPGEWKPAPCQLYCVAADALHVTGVFRADIELAPNTIGGELVVRARVTASFAPRITLVDEETLVAASLPRSFASAPPPSAGPASSVGGDVDPPLRGKSGTLPSPKPRR